MAKQNNDKKKPNEALKYSGMAIKMAIVIAAGVFGGQYLDEKLNTQSPWMTIVFSLVGVALAIYFVISDTSR